MDRALKVPGTTSGDEPPRSLATRRRDLTSALTELGIASSHARADTVAYARDLWPRQHLAVRAHNIGPAEPLLITWPEDVAAVARLVTLARREGTKLVPFGGGSGVCAGVLPERDAVIVDLKRLDRIRSLDRATRTLVVESGLFGLPLEEHLEREGFTLGHFPSSISCSTVGGWVATRSAGQCSSKYGKIEDMVLGLEVVTGRGDVVTLPHRARGPSLVPLLVGSEGACGFITASTLQLHPRPLARSFASWSFDETEDGWDAMRRLVQSGLRPAVARLYDPFDAMMARMGAVKEQKPSASEAAAAVRALPKRGKSMNERLAALLAFPQLLNTLVEHAGHHVFGGALLLVIFEGTVAEVARDLAAARRVVERANVPAARAATWEGEGAARRWLEHRYAVSYRQAHVLRSGLFLDTMEVAAPWSKLGALYDGVRRALGEDAFVMAHFSHAYPDGCCIYFTFVGRAGGPEGREAAEESVYDAIWHRALAAAHAAGGTCAHHHGIGRSKAHALARELGAGGVAWLAALKRTFDPDGILNPGVLDGRAESRTYAPRTTGGADR